MNFYRLDPAHFYTKPGLSWNAALWMTGVKLELLTEEGMHLIVEEGVRGGVSTIIKRHAKANNKYMGENFDREAESVYLLDLDANNLYGWAKSQSLPTDDLRWVLDEEIEELQANIMKLDQDSERGYILEVDLEIPEDKHDFFNQYVPAPEHVEINISMLSPANKECLRKLDMKHTKGKKLIPNLHNKKKYVLHYRALQCYLELGLKLKNWLKNYIDFNTEERKRAKNTFEKNFFKLMNNSVFGKTIENLRNRTDIELVNNARRLEKVLCKPSAESFHRFNDHLVGVRKKIASTQNE